MNTIIRHRAERIAVGVDGSVASHAAVRWAIDHARSGDTVTLIHVWQPSPVTIETGLVEAGDDTGGRRFVDRELARVGALPRDRDVTLTGEVIHGEAAEGLGDVPADVIVIGAGSHGRVVGALLGSVSARLAHHPRVPLVIVPIPDPIESAD